MRNRTDIEELNEISQDNKKNYQEILKNISVLEEQARAYHHKLDALDVSIEGEIKTARSAAYQGGDMAK